MEETRSFLKQPPICGADRIEMKCRWSLEDQEFPEPEIERCGCRVGTDEYVDDFLAPACFPAPPAPSKIGM